MIDFIKSAEKIYKGETISLNADDETCARGICKASPDEIKQWHENLKTDKKLGVLRYFVKVHWGNLAQEFLKIVESPAFEKNQIGFNRYGSIYIFALDDNRYIKAQTYCYRIDNEFFYYVKNGKEFLEKIKE